MSLHLSINVAQVLHQSIWWQRRSLPVLQCVWMVFRMAVLPVSCCSHQLAHQWPGLVKAKHRNNLQSAQ
jgi:hypothetical protein